MPTNIPSAISASPSQSHSPVIIVGAGLAGLVAAHELTKRRIPCIILDQEPASNIGGQAFWSLGGIFCVDSADQRSKGIKDSKELALRDWLGTAGFDREDDINDGKYIGRRGDDYWGRKWAEAFVDFAAGEMESYLKDLGVKFLAVGWAERGDGRPDGHGNSVPRFHLTWGTGPEIVRVFEEPVRRAEEKGLVDFRFRHRVDELILDEHTGRVVGVRGRVLEPSVADRGVATSRIEVSSFEIRKASAVLIATGGIGGNIDAVKRNWPVSRLGPKIPSNFVIGVPAHVDGRMIDIAHSAGASTVNMDRMWHYTEGLSNWSPIWPNHGIRVIPGPSSLWLDATGKRLPTPLYPGCDTLASLRHICSTGHDYTWFILNRSIISREFALSGSEQNPDITSKSYLQTLFQRVLSRQGTQPVQSFLKHGADFVTSPDLHTLVDGMNNLAAQRSGPTLSYEAIKREIDARDAQTENKFSKDAQVMLINNARQYWPDWFRITKPGRLTDPSCGPLIAVRMNLLTRKSLGGLQTDLDGNVICRPDKSDATIADDMNSDAETSTSDTSTDTDLKSERYNTDGETLFPGLYAAGEAAGFGGGGMHGYSSLEGTFLGGCIFTGLKAARAIARNIEFESEGLLGGVDGGRKAKL